MQCVLYLEVPLYYALFRTLLLRCCLCRGCSLSVQHVVQSVSPVESPQMKPIRTQIATIILTMTIHTAPINSTSIFTAHTSKAVITKNTVQPIEDSYSTTNWKRAIIEFAGSSTQHTKKARMNRVCMTENIPNKGVRKM